MTKVLIALGSNIRQEENISRAIRIIGQLIPDAVFSTPVWTDPVPVKGKAVSRRKYLNCTATGHTTLSEESLTAKLKQVEAAMGDSHQNHVRSKVIIDLDLIMFGNDKIREIIWK